MNPKEDLQAELERLSKENEELKQNRSGTPLSMKVSPKGALSVYGLGRFPVTLYKEQWERLLGISEEIQRFLVENKSLLKTKE